MPDANPAWPVLMDLDTAGAYLTLRPGLLASLLRQKNILPVVISARQKRWRRDDLDDLVRQLAGTGASAERVAEAAVEAFDWALEAVERRGPRSRPAPSPRPRRAPARRAIPAP